MHEVLIVDDHPLFRRALKNLLATQPDRLRVVGEAGSGAEAVALARQLHPALVLLDLHMKGEPGGLEALRRIKECAPAPRVIMVTASEDIDDLKAALRAGADGYLLKDMPVQDLLDGMLRTLQTGAMALSDSLAAPLAAAMREPPRPRSRSAVQLTPQESRVLEHIRLGRSNRDIARELGISEDTVKVHVKRVLRKINVHSRTQAAIWALGHD